MKVTILGATGRTGRLVLERALAAGHECTVLVRDAGKLSAHDARVHVVAGQLDDAAAVERAVSGADAVISALGPRENRPPYRISAAMRVLIGVMQRAGVRRLVITAGAGVAEAGDRPSLFNRGIELLLKTFARHIYEDMRGAVEQVHASGLDWTVVRAPRLTDDPGSGRVRVGMVGSVGMSLARADLAEYLVGQLASADQIRRTPAISN